MITAREIRQKAERKYADILQALLKGEACFPLELRSDKALSKDFALMSREIAEVFSASKDRTGFGYAVRSAPVKTRQHGIQDIPKAIVFEQPADYLRFLNKTREYSLLVSDADRIRTALPRLEPWVLAHPKAVIQHHDAWPDLIGVCQWFSQHYEPDRYYIRELPLGVHTKFVEEHKTVLRSLLEELVPHVVNPAESVFEKRFRLKYDQPLIRFRALDPSCWPHPAFRDVTVPIEAFNANPLPCARMFIIENKMNFLTFPEVPRAVALWGKGFALDALKHTRWMASMEITYWSDLDAQGFQMLSQLRSYFPQTTSFMMDMDVLEACKAFVVPGTPGRPVALNHLTAQEQQVYALLTMHNQRLEQERIHQHLVLERLSRTHK